MNHPKAAIYHFGYLSYLVFMERAFLGYLG